MTTIQPLAQIIDLPEAEYHAHPALSCSGAKRLIESCPALFKWERNNPPPSKPAFDFGSAAHRKVLGAGWDVTVIDAADWRTKAAKEQRDEVESWGGVAILKADAEIIDAMAEVIKAHPLAVALLQSGGTPEASLFATDPETGIGLRGRLDMLPPVVNGRVIVPDYKTSVSAQPRAFARNAANFNYHMQHAWYVDLVQQNVGDDVHVDFVFVVQEKTAPYLVSVIELDSVAVHAGRDRNRKAIDLYAKCVADDHWPSYTGDEVALVSLPVWATREEWTEA